MSGKWGESFLKSGLPLEHLAISTFAALGFVCDPNPEYRRPNRDGKEEWFELDFEAEMLEGEPEPALRFIVECKYHDPTRFWILMPHVPERWRFEDRVLNFAPFAALGRKRESTLLRLAPPCSRGVVVSQDGQRQDDALYTAIQQLAHGFLPLVLRHGFDYSLDVKRGYSPNATAYVPVIVTNAALYRLRPDITDLSNIRSAKSPDDIAQPMAWGWCYFDPSQELIDGQWALLDGHKEGHSELLSEFPGAAERMTSFIGRPNWIAVINIAHLRATVESIQECFRRVRTLPIDQYSKTRWKKRR